MTNHHSPSETPARREFNTSRANKAVGDTSTVDFAYFPKLFTAEFNPEPAEIRVPIMPNIHSDTAEAILERYPELDAAAGAYQDTDGGSTLMKAEISALDGSTNASAMSDVHDGHTLGEMTVDALTSLTDTVTKSAHQVSEAVTDKEGGSVRQVWNGFLDDLLGPKRGKA